MKIRRTLLFMLMIVSGAALAQNPQNDFEDALGLARLKNYTAGRSSSENRYVLSNDDSKHILPGDTLVIADLDGPGMVSHIWFTGGANEFAAPRLMRLRVYYDGKKTPSVDAPMGDFFGVGNGYETDLDSVMIRDTSLGRARNSYWPMPFRKHCKITVTNEGARMKSLYYHVDWRKYKSLPDDIGYFHAYYRQEQPAVAGRHYAFLNIRGKGQYVGTVLSIIQTQISWFGEGDDLFYVDGAAHPQIYGTGSEDYFNEAWGLRETSGRWTGSPVAEGERIGSRLTGYRWHVPDPIPFTESIWAGIEHYGWTYNADGKLRNPFEERADYYSSVAFWYQDGVNEGLPEPPFGSARLPLGNATQIMVQDEIKDVTTEKGKAFVQRNVDFGKDLLTLEAQGVDSRINIPLDIAEAGRYEVVAEIAKAPDYGNYVALVDNQPTNLDTRVPEASEIPFPGPIVYHNYLSEVYLSVQRPLGWFHFTKGRHTVSLVCVGKDNESAGYNVGVYDLVLEKLPPNAGDPEPETVHQLTPTPAEAVPAVPEGTIVFRGLPLAAYLDRLKTAPTADRPDVLRALGSFGEDAAPALAQLSEALRDSDPQARVAAAWAISQIGPRAAAAIPDLGMALNDSDHQVRIHAALAFRAMGPAGSAGIPVLIGALNDPVDFVRAAAVEGLGSMGASAQAAVKPLIARLQTKDEHGVVLGRVVHALGDIGPDAKEALPILEQAVKVHRMGPEAEEAILKIEGKSVPTWW
jgi:hypothetical protein